MLASGTEWKTVPHPSSIHPSYDVLVQRNGRGRTEGWGGEVYVADRRVGRMRHHGGGRRAVCFADPDGTQPRVVHAAECTASLTVAVPFFLSDRFAPPDHTLHLVSPQSTHATRTQTVRQTHSPPPTSFKSESQSALLCLTNLSFPLFSSIFTLFHLFQPCPLLQPTKDFLCPKPQWFFR